MHKGKKHVLILFVLLLCFGNMPAQEGLTFQEVEKQSYELYEQKQWKELDSHCKRAFKNGYDYYYLQLRAGIALFQLKKYRAAIVNFKKALQFNSDDNVANEYLYYCYLYSNRQDAALLLSKSFNADFAAYMNTKGLSPFKEITADGGTKLSDSINLFKPANFVQLTLKHSVARKYNFLHAINYYMQNESRFRVQQTQYYLGFNMPIKKELSFTAATHVIYDNTFLNEIVVNTFTVQDPPPRPGAPLPPVRSGTTTQTVEKHEQSLGVLAAMALTKHTSYLDMSLGTTFMLLDTVSQIQVNGGLLFYPFQNNECSIGINAHLHTEDKSKRMNLAWSPIITAHVYKGFYLSLNYFSNTGLNVSEQNGAFINNSYDYTLQRFSVSPSLVFSPKLSIYATLALEEKKQLTQDFLYHYNIFSIGLKINPFKKHA